MGGGGEYVHQVFVKSRIYSCRNCITNWFLKYRLEEDSCKSRYFSHEIVPIEQNAFPLCGGE